MIPIQSYAIDISTWRADESFGLAYPEGARPKRAIFSPAEPIPGIKPNWRYLFKLSARPYPEQYWAEIIAYLIGTDLGLTVPPACAAYDPVQGQCGALIEWFYEEDKQAFVAAGDGFQRIIPDFDRVKGTQHNVMDARAFSDRLIGKTSFRDFAQMLLFDSLIGNSDRHQDNWGYIVEPDDQAEEKVSFRFAPWFDNGTSMGHERFPAKFQAWAEVDYVRYINKGRHHFRERSDSHERLSHMDSMRRIKENAPRLATTLHRTLQRFDLEQLRSYLDQLIVLETLEHGRLTEERASFIYKLFEYRTAFIGNILK